MNRKKNENEDKRESLFRENAALKEELHTLRKNETEIREELAFCRDVLSSMRDWYWEVDENIVITFCSNQIMDVMCFNPAKLFGHSPLEYIVTEDRLRIERVMAELIELRQPFKNVECCIYTRDGGRMHSLVSGVPFYSDGVFRGYRGIIRDITERQRMESLMGKIRDLALALGSVRDLNEGLALCLRTALSLSGIDKGGVYLLDQSNGSLRLVVHEGLSPDFVRQASFYTADSPNTRLVLSGETIYIHAREIDPASNETTIPEEMRLVAIVPIQHQGNVIGCLNFASSTLDEFPVLLPHVVEALVAPIGNAIARLQSEQAIRESEAALRSVFQATPVGILFIKERNILSANDSMCEMLGYTQEEVVGGSVMKAYFTEREFEEIGDKLYAQVRQKGRGSVETRMRRKDGAAIHVILTGGMMHADNPSHGFVVTVHDITDRKRAEEEREHTLSILQATLESTEEGILVANSSGGLSIYNRKFLEMWAISESDIAAMNDICLLEYIMSRITEPEKVHAQFKNYHDQPDMESSGVFELIDGRVVEWYSRPQQIGDDVVGRIWSFRDVTGRKRLEHQLLQAQKMETVGRLAGGVAHDFNNILTVINGTADVTLMFMEADDPHYEAFEEIRKAGERAANLTRQLLAFSRKQIVEPRIINMNRTLLDMDKMFRRLIGANIELITILDELLLPVKIDPGQIEQVLTNLVVNARDAMPDGGKLTIETRIVMLEKEYVRVHPDIIPGKYVMLTVSDTGTGMSEEVLSHLFEPFFTTKSVGKGTGLGLATCYGIVKQGNGDIEVESAQGRGAIFRVYLPVYEGEGSAMFTDLGPGEVPSGTETVLVVEDDPTVSALVAGLLDLTGYQVHAAANGEEALSLLDRIPETIHLLITDMVMPLMGGRELADRLAILRPHLKVLFMSGYADGSLVQINTPGRMFHFIQKPFTSAAFLRKVRETIDR